MHSPTSRRLRRLRCQLAACTAPKEAAQHPEPLSALTPSLPRCCQALRDGSNSWEEQGEPARLLLWLHLTPVVLRSRPQKYLPLSEPGPAGVKGPLEGLLPCPWFSHTVFALILGWEHDGQVSCRTCLRLSSHPHNGTSEQSQKALGAAQLPVFSYQSRAQEQQQGSRHATGGHKRFSPTPPPRAERVQPSPELYAARSVRLKSICRETYLSFTLGGARSGTDLGSFPAHEC